MKQLLLALIVLGLMVRGYFVYQQHQLQTAGKVVQPRQVVSQIRTAVRNADAEADAAASGDLHPASASPPTATASKVSTPAPAAAGNPARPEIEAALREMHVTTIMPGAPGVFILGKQDYTEGGDLPLPKGRKARIVAVDDGGVRLTCEGMAFHLDPPAAPDLAALRKKKN